jgi:hypothetical protein
MAMKPCIECNKKISTSAKLCPHCGKKRPTGGMSLISKLLIGLIVSFSGLALLGSLSSSNIDSKPVISSNTSINENKKYNFPPKKNYNHKYKFKTSYDKIDNYTSFDFNGIKLGSGITLRGFVLSTGNKLSTPDIIELTFASSSEDWRYLTYRDLRLLLNGVERISLPTPNNSNTVGRGYVLEQMSVTLPIAVFLKIVNSDTVEGSIGTTNFKFNKSQIEALRDYASRLI